MEIKKTLYMNKLFSHYQNLLTKRQREYMTEYYEEDYSLQEIADNYDISRQAVYDSLRRTEKILMHYEEEMHLVHHSERQFELIQDLKAYVKEYYPDDAQLQALVNQMLEAEM